MDKGSNVFISHSINCEDVLLRRIFSGVSGGFFVDVGAADPVNDSDTYALSKLGWKGINVEPNPVFFQRLEEERPEDCNLRVAVSDHRGLLDWYQVGDTGLSTCDPDEAARASSKGYVVTRHTVEAMTLVDIFSAHASAPIDLLKVDVEGLEWAVLSSNDWDRWRPKVVVVEATLPESKQRRPDRIGPFLSERGYRHAHFDGLNDWYVEAEFRPPPDAFLPPNIFDGFVTRRQVEAETHSASLSEQLLQANEYVASLLSERKALLADRDSILADRDSILADRDSILADRDSILADRDFIQVDRDSIRADRDLLRAAFDDADRACADLRQAYSHSQDENRRAGASLMDLHESLRRSRSANQEAEERYAALARDFEASLRKTAFSREALAETEARLQFQRYALADARRKTDDLLAELQTVQQGQQIQDKILADLRRRVGALAESDTRAKVAEARCRALERSSSWRVTRPMRALVRLLRRR